MNQLNAKVNYECAEVIAMASEWISPLSSLSRQFVNPHHRSTAVLGRQRLFYPGMSRSKCDCGPDCGGGDGVVNRIARARAQAGRNTSRTVYRSFKRASPHRVGTMDNFPQIPAVRRMDEGTTQLPAQMTNVSGRRMLGKSRCAAQAATCT